jgi:5-methylcytosine-specific restriction endonuclease McrA
MQEDSLLITIPDDELLERLGALVQGSRRTEADLVAHIGEVDRRRLYVRAAAPSMFVYCTDVLHLSEAEAYLRIAAARAVRRHPQLLAMLGDGRLHLSAIAKLAPHLTPENCDALLRRATHASKRQIEELVAEISPRPDVPCLVRKLPERNERQLASTTCASTPLAGTAQPEVVAVVAIRLQDGVELCPDGVAPVAVRAGEALKPVLSFAPSGVRLESNAARGSSRDVLEPLAPSRYKVQFTASAELCDKLERLQALLSAEIPGADMAVVIDRAVTQTLRRLEARRYARTSAVRNPLALEATSGRARSAQTPTDERRHPRAAARENTSAGRHIPAAVRRAVFERDGGRCRYRDETGRRCPERHRLEYHHLHPFAMGGAHALDNVRLMCRSHNLYLAERDYGQRAMAAYRRPIRHIVAPPGQCGTT